MKIGKKGKFPVFCAIFTVFLIVLPISCKQTEESVDYNEYLEAPKSLSPENGISVSSLTPLMDWEDVDSAAEYKVQVSENSSFSSLIIDSPVKEFRYRVPLSYRLMTGKTNYWQVRARNNDGKKGTGANRGDSGLWWNLPFPQEEAIVVSSRATGPSGLQG